MIWLKKQLKFYVILTMQDFDLKIIMGYEISPTCIYLTKRGLIQKPSKSELITELKSIITKIIPTHLQDHQRNVIIDFMAYVLEKCK